MVFVLHRVSFGLAGTFVPAILENEKMKTTLTSLLSRGSIRVRFEKEISGNDIKTLSLACRKQVLNCIEARSVG